MKKIIGILIILTIVFTCVSCGDNNNIEKETNYELNTEKETEKIQVKNFTINSNELSKYTIVYPKSGDETLASGYIQKCLTDSASKVNETVANTFYEAQFGSLSIDYEKQSAEHLQALIQENFGVTLPVSLDTNTAISDYEILIGNNNRGLQQTTMRNISTEKESYSICVFNTSKMSICGNCSGAMYQAMDALIANIKENNMEIVNLEGGYKLQGSADLKHIACLGDSITHGSKAMDANSENYSYPSVLQRVLWKTCIVENFGVAGTCMCDSILVKPDSWSYRRTSRYKECLTKASDIDYVIVMLGTNDVWGNPEKIPDILTTRNAKTKIKNEYLNSYQTMISDFSAKNENVKFLLLSSPYSSGNTYETTAKDMFENLLIPLQKSTAETTNTSYADMYQYTKDNFTSAEYFSDKLHPNDLGYARIAKQIAIYMQDLFQIQ